MKRYCQQLMLLGTLVSLGHARTIDMNLDWRFHKNTVKNAERLDFDDSQWRQLDVPHDWSIEDLDPASGPLDPCAVGSYNTGYFVGGTAWYRKHFTLDEKTRGQRVQVHFDGVYMNADVWINGHHLGCHPYGYTAFWYDLTSHLRWGQDNVLAVEVKNEGVNTRWYSGSGIYRQVWLTLVDPVHIDHWGPHVTSSEVSLHSAQVRVRTGIRNESGQAQPIVLRTRFLRPDGEEAAVTSIQGWAGAKIDQTVTITRPSLWSLDTPSLYQLVQEVMIEGKPVDLRKTTFGIRSVTCDARTGFQLNGQPLLLQGLCMHHDNYMLGSAALPRAEERRVEVVKAAGYNAIRCSHNPPSSAFLEACDRAGLLVIDEAFDQWTKKKHKQDYHQYFQEWWQRDLASMVLRDRNHPSVVMWSIGNEIPEQRSAEGAELAGEMVAYIKSLDDSRLITIGANMAGEVGDPLFAHLDVVGYNYQLADYASDHRRVPDRVMFASESFAKEAFDYWDPVETRSHVIGDFVWTGFDYLGEASIGWFGYKKGWKGTGPYPWHLAYCGEIDALGFKRPAAYYRDVLWRTGINPISAFVRSPAPSLPDQDPNNILLWAHPDIHPSWTWPGYEGRDLDVVVYGSGGRAELILNGQSLGSKPTSRETRYMAVWKVPYVPGELKAVAHENGRAQTDWILKTAGSPAKLRLRADRSQIQADGQDLSYVTVEILDAEGIRIPQADSLLHFAIQGQGTFVGAGNGNPRGHESFQKPQHTAFHGRCLVVLKSTTQPGLVTLTATAEGLASDAVVIQTK